MVLGRLCGVKIMLEYEKKVLLTRDEYAVLADQCRGLSVLFQTNYYFDTDDLYMNRKGITCRVRTKNGRYKTTIKKHEKDSLNCSVEEDLYEGEKLNSNVFKALGMHLQGGLTTTRIILHKDAFCEVVLDRNTYLGCDDFEIEVEYSKNCEDRATAHLKGAAERLVAAMLIDSVENFMLRVGESKSKSERFFDRKRAERR